MLQWAPYLNPLSWDNTSSLLAPPLHTFPSHYSHLPFTLIPPLHTTHPSHLPFTLLTLHTFPSHYSLLTSPLHTTHPSYLPFTLLTLHTSPSHYSPFTPPLHTTHPSHLPFTHPLLPPVLPQESLCATYSAGLGIACVVNVGDERTHICCVEEGVSNPNTRYPLWPHPLLLAPPPFLE